MFQRNLLISVQKQTVTLASLLGPHHGSSDELKLQPGESFSGAGVLSTPVSLLLIAEEGTEQIMGTFSICVKNIMTKRIKSIILRVCWFVM